MDAKNILLILVAIITLQISYAVKPPINLTSLQTSIDPKSFKCHETGIFPDPFDCFTYHYCIAYTEPIQASTSNEKISYIVNIAAKCDNGLGYDPKTNRCTLKLENDQCPEIVPNCTTTYQMGPLERNPSLYYFCAPSGNKLTPELRYCPLDMVHNGHGCIDNTPELDSDIFPICLYNLQNILVNSKDLYICEKSDDNFVLKKYTCPSNFFNNGTICVKVNPPKLGINDDGLCIEQGRFYHPMTSNKYRECSGPGVIPKEALCGIHHEFDPMSKKCLYCGYGNCIS